MPLRTRFQDELKTAMHARNEIRIGTLRLIMAALKDRDIQARTKGNWDGIGEDEILGMLQSMIKQRQESIKMYEIGKRADLVARESAEIEVVQSFLPHQMSDSEVEKALTTAITEIGAAGMRDMGKVMAVLKEKYAGQMDFGKVSGQVKDRLSKIAS